MDIQNRYLRNTVLKDSLLDIFIFLLFTIYIGMFFLGWFILKIVIVGVFFYETKLIMLDKYEYSMRRGIVREKFLKYDLLLFILFTLIYTILTPLMFESKGRTFGYTLNGQIEIFTNLLLLFSIIRLAILLYEERNKKKTILFILAVVFYIFIFDRGIVDIFKADNLNIFIDEIIKIPYIKTVDFLFYFKAAIRTILSGLIILYSNKMYLERDV